MSAVAKPGLVCWASMPIQGTGGRKPRPVVVISSRAFTSRTGLVHLFPVSTTPPSRLEAIIPKLAVGPGRLDPKSRLLPDILITEDAGVLGEKIGELDVSQLRDAIEAFTGTLAEP